jgi:hypothetical protein
MTSAYSPYSDLYIEFDDKNDSPGAAKVYMVAGFICRYAILAIKKCQTTIENNYTNNQTCVARIQKRFTSHWLINVLFHAQNIVIILYLIPTLKKPSNKSINDESLYCYLLPLR